jgi:hypothetical protein
VGDRNLIDNMAIASQKGGKPQPLRQTIVWLCLVDENGDRLFDRPEEIVELDARGVEEVLNACTALMGISKTDMEELEGN